MTCGSSGKKCLQKVPKVAKVDYGSLPSPSSLVLTFGKYKGQSLAHVAQHDPGYLKWMSENMNQEKWRDAARSVLGAQKGSGGSGEKENNLDTPLSFGKFAGWTARKLARAGDAGREYLRWGAENLKSPKWRRTFSEALDDEEVETDPNLAATLISSQEGIPYEEALAYITNEILREKEWQEAEAARSRFRQKVFAKYAPRLEVSPVDVSRIAHQMEKYQESFMEPPPRERFSSDEKYHICMEMLKELQAQWDFFE